MLPLDRIIRETKYNKLPIEHSSNAILIRFDSKKKKILNQSNPLVNLANRNIKKYIVFSGVKADHIVHDCRISTVKHSLDISVKYQVESIKGSEEKLISAIQLDQNPTSAIDRILRNWVSQDFIRDKTEGSHEFIINYYKYENALLNYLRHRANNELGLKLDAEFILKGEVTTTPLKVEFVIPAILNDYQKELPIRVRTKISLDEENKELALINNLSEDDIKKIIQRNLRDTLLDEVRLHTLVYDKVSTEELCKRNLDNILASVGRKAIFLSLEIDTNLMIPDSRVPHDYTVKCRIKDAKDVEIENSIRLSLFDLATFMNANVGNIKLKIEEILQDVIQDVVYLKNYVDLITGFEECERDIHKGVTKECERIGYSVTQHIVLAEEDTLRLAKEGFYVVSDGKYSTRDANIEFELQAVVTGRITELKKIEDYLKPTIDFEEVLSDTIKNTLRRKIHKFDPHEVYTEFYDADKEGEKSLDIEGQLIELIITELQDKFHATDVNIVLKPLPSRLVKRLKDLRGRSRKFTISIASHREAGRMENVDFEVYFNVVDIWKDGWYIFQSRTFESTEEELKEIQEQLVASIDSLLSLASGQELRYTNYTNLKNVRKKMSSSTSAIRENFGLEVTLGPIRRLTTGLEQTIQDTELTDVKERITKDKKTFSDQRKALQAHLLELTDKIHKLEIIGDIDDEEEIEALKVRRDEIEKKLQSSQLSTFTSLLPERGESEKSVFGLLEKNHPKTDEEDDQNSNDVEL